MDNTVRPQVFYPLLKMFLRLLKEITLADSTAGVILVLSECVPDHYHANPMVNPKNSTIQKDLNGILPNASVRTKASFLTLVLLQR